MKFILKNIHTIILLIGIGLVMYGFFLISQMVGYIGSGVLAIMLATYIDRNVGQGMKVYILEQWTHDYGDSYSDILGVYSSLDKARDYIDSAGYRYEDSFFQEYSEYLETYSKEEKNGVYKTISILERELDEDLGELVFEAVGTE